MTRIPHDRRRQLLVSAALRVVSRSGLAAATTRAICAEAGMPLAAFHRVVPSRDDLLRELVGHVVAGEGDATFLSLLDEAGDVRSAIRTAFTGYLDLVRSDPGREQGMFELTQYALRTPALHDLPQRQYAHYHELSRELLRIGARRFGVEWDVDEESLARLVTVLSDGITLAWLADRDDERAARDIEHAADAIAAHARVRVAG
jgi:AcrR family transcriptional regulator